MPLIESFANGTQTQLNKLKFGEISTIGTEPIVTKKIPTGQKENGHSSNQASRRIDDLKRIGTILTQKPGLNYLANETLLNAAKVTPKKDPTKTLAGNIISKVGANLFNSVKIIGSTLAQVPLNGTGTHFVKGFAGREGYLEGIRGHQLSSNSSAVFDDSNTNFIGGEPRPWYQKDKAPETAGGALVGGGLLQYLNTKYKPQDGIPLFTNPFKNEVKKENRVLLGNPAARTASERINYSANRKIETVDRINELPLYNGDVKPVDESRDMIKFRFNIITPDKENNNTYVHFRAYLDSFGDNFSGNWSGFNYIGRGEQFYTYQGFDRSINLSFKIAAQTRYEMQPLYRKIVYLASATAPTYSGDGFMRGTMTKLTVGDYVREMPGFIESVNYSWEQDYQWEIAMNNPEAVNGDGTSADIDQQELPMVLNCSIQFKPIHNFVPETGLKHYITTDIAKDPRTVFFPPDPRDGTGRTFERTLPTVAKSVAQPPPPKITATGNMNELLNRG